MDIKVLIQRSKMSLTSHKLLIAGVVYGFNVLVPDKVNVLAKSRRVTIKSFNIIYRLIGDLKERLVQKLLPVEVDEIIGWPTFFHYIQNTSVFFKVILTFYFRHTFS